MNSKLRSHADTIVKEAVAAVLPDAGASADGEGLPCGGGQSGMADGARGGAVP